MTETRDNTPLNTASFFFYLFVLQPSSVSHNHAPFHSSPITWVEKPAHSYPTTLNPKPEKGYHLLSKPLSLVSPKLVVAGFKFAAAGTTWSACRRLCHRSAVARSVRIINCKCISRELSYSVLPKISQCRAGLITLTGVTLNGKQSRRRWLQAWHLFFRIHAAARSTNSSPSTPFFRIHQDTPLNGKKNFVLLPSSTAARCFGLIIVMTCSFSSISS